MGWSFFRHLNQSFSELDLRCLAHQSDLSNLMFKKAATEFMWPEFTLLNIEDLNLIKNKNTNSWSSCIEFTNRKKEIETTHYLKSNINYSV